MSNSISLRGLDYPLCFNATAMLEIERQFGSFDSALKTLNKGMMEPALRFLHALMLGGSARCKALGEDCPQVPAFETVAALLDLRDLKTLPALVAGLLDADSRHDTEAAPPKNGDAVPAAEDK